MKNILIIDTTNNKEVIVGLKTGKLETFKKSLLDTRKAQLVLPLIDQILEERNLNINNISAIEVNTGPGSFTGIRVGLSIANTLGFLLKIPVNGRKVGEPAEAIY